MSSVNKITLMGSVSGEVDIKVSDQGVSRARFILSVQRIARPGAPVSFDEIPMLAWGETAENLHKLATNGSLVLVKGRIQVSSFDDPQGNRKWVTEIDVRDYQVLQSGGFEASTAEAPASVTQTSTETQTGIAESDFDFSPASEEKEAEEKEAVGASADTTFSEQLGDDVPF